MRKSPGLSTLEVSLVMGMLFGHIGGTNVDLCEMSLDSLCLFKCMNVVPTADCHYCVSLCVFLCVSVSFVSM